MSDGVHDSCSHVPWALMPVGLGKAWLPVSCPTRLRFFPFQRILELCPLAQENKSSFRKPPIVSSAPSLLPPFPTSEKSSLLSASSNASDSAPVITIGGHFQVNPRACPRPLISVLREIEIVLLIVTKWRSMDLFNLSLHLPACQMHTLNCYQPPWANCKSDVIKPTPTTYCYSRSLVLDPENHVPPLVILAPHPRAQGTPRSGWKRSRIR